MTSTIVASAVAGAFLMVSVAGAATVQSPTQRALYAVCAGALGGLLGSFLGLSRCLP